MFRPRSTLFLIVLVGAALRGLALNPVLGDLDAANFAAALEHFDPLHQAPHWPGYPVYVVVARLFSALGAPPHLALALPGIFGWLLAAPLFFAGVSRTAGPRVAILTSCAAAFLPGAVLVGGWSASDGLGVAVLLGAVGAALLAPRSARFALLTGVLVGLGLGVRLSWWPLFLGVAIMAGRGPLVGVGASFATSLWGFGLLAVVGLDGIGHALGFGAGHFQRFGGAIDTGESLGARSVTFIETLAGTLGGTIPATVIICLGVVGIIVRDRPRRAPSAPLTYGVAAAVAYTAWVLLAQNVARPRHLVPLALVVALVAAAAWATSRLSWAVPVVAGLAALPLALEQRTPSPQASVARTIASYDGPVQVFAGPEGRLLERLVPGLRVWRPVDERVLREEVAFAHARGATVFVTSHAIGADALTNDFELVAHFEQPRHVRGPDHETALFMYQPEVVDVASR